MSRPRRYDDRVPMAPFQDWIEDRIRFYEKQYEFGGEVHGSSDAVRRTAYDLGLDPRTLNKYRRGVTAAKDKRRKTNEVPAETFSRERIEEALWHAGVFMWEVYEEVAA